MNKATFNVPALWADHHTLAIREALFQLDGVKDVIASSLFQDVLVEYDPGAVTADELAAALSQAGYKIDEKSALPTYPERIDDTSDWFRFQERITETDMRDLTMSGDHRKY